MIFKPYAACKPARDARLGQIPSHWTEASLKRAAVFAYGDSLPDEKRMAGDVPVFGSNGQVGSHNVANTLAPAIIIGRKGSFGAVKYSDVAGFAIDTTYFVDKRYTSHDFRWLYYLLITSGLGDISQDTGVPGLSREVAYNRQVAIPPRLEQRAIADFLDRETAKIDNLIAKQEQLIEGSQEHWQATLAGAISSGLRSADAYDAHEWLGSVPTHWQVKRISRVFRIFSGYAFSSMGFTRENAELPLLITPGSFTDRGTLRPESDGVRFEGSFPSEFRLAIGDLVIVMTDLSYRKLLLGRAAFVEVADVLLNQRIGKVILNDPDAVDPKFVRFALNANCVREQIIASARGATVFHSSPEKIRACWMAIPPLIEQHEIVRYLERVEGQVESLTSVCLEVINRLRERRSALITAAVTGQIEVAANISAEAAA